MDVDDEDEVVQEIPVFLTQPDNPLYIFQYLNQPASFESPHKIVKSCVKPENQEVELEMELETRDTCYSRSMAEQLALNCDGFEADEKDKMFKRDLVDRKFLKSEKISVENNNLTVGILHDQKITLAPVNSILALKPHLPYLDKTDKRAKQDMKDEGELSEEEPEEENGIVKAVTVKFARRENDRMKKARERSSHFINAKTQEEPWYETRYCDMDSKESTLETNKLKSCLEDRIIAMTLDKETYLQCLIPLHDDDESWKKDQVLCLRQMKTLPLTEQIRQLLKDVKIISTPRLKSFLSLTSPGEESEMKKFLQQHALLVHGNWVVKSDVLFPKESASPFSGVPGDVMCTARDYLVFLFTQHVLRKRFASPLLS
uniref:DNA-directed RNA polymerase III subunit RPC5 n=2 Tax=Cacopsylla melanoneura TaxID=428564 RepID=A0A8D8RXJ9_9HEMI